MTARLFSTLLAAGLFLAPAAGAARAADIPVPAPTAIECPPVDVTSGVPTVPAGAPAECVYIQATEGLTVTEGDPCAPDASGVTPEMCQSGVGPTLGGPADGGFCWIGSDTTPVCASGVNPGGQFVDQGRHFAIKAIALSGVRYDVAAGNLDLGADGSFNATIGCNTIAGTYVSGDASEFTAINLVSTKMECLELDQVESALIAILQGGNLTLTSGESGLSAQNSTGTLELIEAMYDVMPISEEIPTSSSGALLAALLLLGIPAFAGAGALSVGLSRRS